MIKVLDEREKRVYKAALESLEEWMPLAKRPLEIETMKDAIRLFKEAVETGYVSYELEHLCRTSNTLISLVMKLKKLVDAGVQRQPTMSPERHGQKVISIPTHEGPSKQ